MNRIILVTGATGKQGGAVARHLLQEGWMVRAFTRKPDSEASLELLRHGAQVVKGDLNDPLSVRSALKDVYGVYGVQNSWEHGVEGEVRQGQILVEEARLAGVIHFVYSSVGSAHRSTGIPHFESKWQIELLLRQSEIPSTVFRPVFFMENLLASDTVTSIGNGVLPLGLIPRKPLQMIAVDDIGAFVTMAFDNPDWYVGKEMDIAGDECSGPQMAAILGTVLDRSVEYRQIPIDQIRAMSLDYASMIEWFNSVGYNADIESLRKLRPSLTDFKQWVYQHKDVLLEEPVHV